MQLEGRWPWQRDYVGAGRDTGDTLAVVPVSGGDAGDMDAVALVVLGEPAHRWASPFPLTQLTESATFPARSSWVRSTPVSTIPVGTPVPVIRSEAAATPILRRLHCIANGGSLDAYAADGRRVTPAVTADTR